MIRLTERQEWALCDANACDPVLLDGESARLKSFVYDREFGMFQCSFGAHPGVMSLLLAWHHGCKDGIDVSEMLGLSYSSGTADAFLMRPGTAFRSTQSKVVEAFSPCNLEDWELMYFGEVRFIDQSMTMIGARNASQ